MATELQRGFPLLRQQTTALLKKNILLSLRNKRTTFLHLFSSLFFIALLFGIQKATDYRSRHPSAVSAVPDPQAATNPAIPACEHKLFIKRPCFDFAWSGSSSSRIQAIVAGILANNPGRPIPASKVISFASKDELINWLLQEPMRTPGALHFEEKNATVISYGVLTNSSTYIEVPRQIEDPTFKFRIPLQLAASREIARSLIGDSTFSWNIAFKQFAHPELRRRDDDDYSISNEIEINNFGPIFFYAVCMFAFVFQMSSIVAEKELKLRQAMAVMGLYDTAYWCSWIIWEGFMSLLSSLFIVLFGMAFQLHVFLENSFAFVFLLFFLFQLDMVAFAFLFSNFVRKTSSASSVGFAIFVVGVLTQAFSVLVYTDTKSKHMYQRLLWSLFPPNPFSGGLGLLLAASRHPGNGISQRRQSLCDIDDTYCRPIGYFYQWQIATFFMWLIVAIYVNNIWTNSTGVKKPYFYFLNPSYWTGKGEYKSEENGKCCGSSSSPPNDRFAANDEGVLEEESRVKQQAKEDNVDPNVAVQLRGLFKTYPKKIKLRCRSCCFCCYCCVCRTRKAYTAVKSLWLNFEKDQLFCLLGPNGAGKTTVINCLTGITSVTHGDAMVYGNSVRTSAGLSNIRKQIGVCSQYDTLWDKLSAKEHLELFASIKGLPQTSNKSEATNLLAQVKLEDVGKVRASSYSGGMKRRLSLAIALIGNPRLLILDEPTTGMDPVTRRHIWNVIESAKHGRSIILTTHSMEEADILADRIGIMAKGRLRCIGNATTLKSRFGAGFITKVSLDKGEDDDNTIEDHNKHHLAVKEFFKMHLDVMPKEEDPSSLTFVIPHEQERQLEEFFKEMENRKSDFGIQNVQIGLSTLEEVFLSIAQKAELDSATAEGNVKTLTLPSGTSIQVHLGAKYVEIPGSVSPDNPRGLMVEVYWEQDDNGNLCISGHSNETPMPSNFRRTPTGLVP
ncbi:ABC transporter A family member 11-like [Ipomoea triloba]|uniref:ABC transporter A family member 11-like n=1 Tax=Ipomoea triloba TaxID=35885 RepID=UPI00125E05AC|nr:ABC transporter A family member 11-like [Ipomoea triloba]